MVLQHLLDFQRLAQCPVIIIHCKLRGRTLVVPSVNGIIMQRQAVHVTTGIFHQHLCPVVIVITRTTGHLVQPIFAVIAAIGLVTPV